MILQGNGSGHDECKQARQALTGPFGSSQCLQLDEHKHESGYRCESLNHLKTDTFKHLNTKTLKQLNTSTPIRACSWVIYRCESLNDLKPETHKNLNTEILKHLNT